MSSISFVSSSEDTRDCSAPLPMVMAPKTIFTAVLDWGAMVESTLTKSTIYEASLETGGLRRPSQ